VSTPAPSPSGLPRLGVVCRNQPRCVIRDVGPVRIFGFVCWGSGWLLPYSGL
jgi:hypothetical protein